MTERQALRLITQGFPEPPARDTAVSHAILRRVSDGVLPDTLRLHRPGPVVAFGPKDRLAPGFAQAVEAAEASGYGAVHRLAGGRAAVFDEGTIGFAWITADPSPRAGIRRRFQDVAEIMAAAFVDLGVDARIGEVPGEYCPGEHSVNARGATKLMGVGQRVVQRAVHVGGVIVVSGSGRVRSVLEPVYRALELAWDPTTAGSVEDEVPGVTWDDVVAAVRRRFDQRYGVIEGGEVDDVTLALAGRLEPRHAV